MVSASDSAVLAGGRAEFKPRLSAAKGQARGAQFVERRGRALEQVRARVADEDLRRRAPWLNTPYRTP